MRLNNVLTQEQLAQRKRLTEFFPVAPRDTRRLTVELVSCEQAIAAVAKEIGLTIDGEEVRVSADGLSASFELAFSVGCDLYVRCDRAWDLDHAVEFPNGAQESLSVKTCSVQLNWSSSHRDVATATACLVLYQRVLGYASAFHAVLDGKRFLSERGWERLVAAAEKDPR